LLTKKYERLIGETLRDPYGRCLGLIIGFSTDNRNQISKIAVENHDGSFIEHGVDRLIIEDNLIVQRPEWKVDSEGLRREAEVSKRRMSALENLYSAGKVSARTYQELSEEYRKVLRSQEDDRQRLIYMLDNRNDELSRQIALLERLLADSEVQHITGELSENASKIAASSLKSGIDRALQEKREVEMDLEALQLLDAVVEPNPQPTAVQSPDLQRAPVATSIQPPSAMEAAAKQALNTDVQQALNQLITSWKPPPPSVTEKEKEKQKESRPDSPLVLRL